MVLPYNKAQTVTNSVPVMVQSIQKRLKIPVIVAILSAALSIAVVVTLDRQPRTGELAASTLLTRSHPDAYSPEMAAERFYMALGQRSFSNASQLCCAKALHEITERAQRFSRLKELTSTYPFAVFRESVDLENGGVILKGLASSDPKDNINGIDVTFVLAKIAGRWCVEQMSLNGTRFF